MKTIFVWKTFFLDKNKNIFEKKYTKFFFWHKISSFKGAQN